MCCPSLFLKRCFNPRTHKGCDQAWHIQICVLSGFNPRTHKGCDFASESVKIFIDVSIHAPTRGATVERARKDGGQVFQSTHPQGVRRQVFRRVQWCQCFNPRTHKGCDNAFVRNKVADAEFQSTHPQGVRRSVTTDIHRTKRVSIHAPTRGATLT